MTEQRSRTELRERFEPVVRLALLESDMDTVAESLSAIRRQLSKLYGVALSALVSFTVSAILLALTIASHK